MAVMESLYTDLKYFEDEKNLEIEINEFKKNNNQGIEHFTNTYNNTQTHIILLLLVIVIILVLYKVYCNKK
jgi:hypothetical protein